MLPFIFVFAVSSLISASVPVPVTGMSAFQTALVSTVAVGAIATAPIIAPIAIIGTAIVQANNQ